MHPPSILRRPATRCLRALAALCLSAFASAALHPACAQGLSLEVCGNLSRYTDAGARVYHLTKRELWMLPQYTVITATSWTPRSAFVGPHVEDILRFVGARGTEVEFHSLNNYSHTIPIAEVARYGVILAHSRNGRRLSDSDFGPLFVVYPRDQYPKELGTPMSEAKYVWQVTGMCVR